MEPPLAPRIPVERTLHGDTVIDDYRWLSDPKDPRTLAYLEAENAHTEVATRHLAGLRDRIFDEIKQRTQETDLSAPVAKGGFWYATRTDEGRQYPTHVRMVGDPDGPVQVLIDVNDLAEGHEYLRLGVLDVSPDGRWLAYSTDVDGSELYTLRFRDLDEDRDLADELTNTYYSSAWSLDARYFFYTTVDAMHRPDKIWRHEIGTPQTDDVLVLHEDDDRMFVSVELTQDERFIVASAGSQTTADARFIPSDDVEALLDPGDAHGSTASSTRRITRPAGGSSLRTSTPSTDASCRWIPTRATSTSSFPTIPHARSRTCSPSAITSWSAVGRTGSRHSPSSPTMVIRPT